MLPREEQQSRQKATGQANNSPFLLNRPGKKKNEFVIRANQNQAVALSHVLSQKQFC